MAHAEAAQASVSKELLRRLPELYNQRRIDLADELFAPDLQFHTHVRPGPEGLARGVEGAREAIVWIQTGWPDSQITIDELIAEGDRAAVRFTFRGTHLGGLHGNPPTGKRAEWSEMLFVRTRDGRIEEIWHELNVMSVLQQIGVFPPLWQVGKVPGPLLALMKLRARIRRHLPGRGRSLSTWRQNLPSAPVK